MWCIDTHINRLNCMSNTCTRLAIILSHTVSPHPPTHTHTIQTGSGKTFTMEGPPPSSSSSSIADDDLCTLAAQTRGMIPRAVEQIFDSATSLAEQGWQVTGWVNTNK